MRIGVGIPCPEFVNSSFAFDNLPMVIGTARKAGHEMYLKYQSGVRTDKNRNVILQEFLNAGLDYVLWLDADMMYPHNIVEKYLEADFDVIGCLYFKRVHPFDPIAYITNPDATPSAPYMSIDPSKIPDNAIAEVDGLGFGGMMVRMEVYKGMGEDKWTHYGDNFHIPEPRAEQMTHDLVFCRDAQRHGFSIKLHTGVKPGHISTQVITQKNWENR
jgi:hypothetical protein